MMKLLTALCLLGSASAFVSKAPVNVVSRAASRVAPSMKVDGLVGDTAPFGYFDPLGFSTGKSMEEMTSYRECELKHGRIAMAATLGWIVQPAWHPLASSCHISHPEDPVQSLYELPLAGKGQILLFIGFVEFLAKEVSKRPNYAPGDLLGNTALYGAENPKWIKYQQKELNNGRLAMFAVMGFWIQDLLFHKTGDLLFAPLLK